MAQSGQLMVCPLNPLRFLLLDLESLPARPSHPCPLLARFRGPTQVLPDQGELGVLDAAAQEPTLPPPATGHKRPAHPDRYKHKCACCFEVESMWVVCYKCWKYWNKTPEDTRNGIIAYVNTYKNKTNEMDTYFNTLYTVFSPVLKSVRDAAAKITTVQSMLSVQGDLVGLKQIDAYVTPMIANFKAPAMSPHPLAAQPIGRGDLLSDGHKLLQDQAAVAAAAAAGRGTPQLVPALLAAQHKQLLLGAGAPIIAAAAGAPGGRTSSSAAALEVDAHEPAAPGAPKSMDIRSMISDEVGRTMSQVRDEVVASLQKAVHDAVKEAMKAERRGRSSKKGRSSGTRGTAGEASEKKQKTESDQ